MTTSDANTLGFKVLHILTAKLIELNSTEKPRLRALGWDGIENLDEFTKRHEALADQAHRMCIAG